MKKAFMINLVFQKEDQIHKYITIFLGLTEDGGKMFDALEFSPDDGYNHTFPTTPHGQIYKPDKIFIHPLLGTSQARFIKSI